MAEYLNLPDELFVGLSEFYIKYINVRQDESNTNVLPGQGQNKFNILFDQINKVIAMAHADTLTNIPLMCAGYQTRYKEFFIAELKRLGAGITLPPMLNLKKQFLKYMIDLIESIPPIKLPTYRTFTMSPVECGSGYALVLPQIIEGIRGKIEKNAIPLIYGKIKDVAKEEIKNEIEDIGTIIEILDGDKKTEEIQIDQIKDYITSTLGIDKQELDTKEFSFEYIRDELSKKYAEFLSIPTAKFDQETKNKIKKSVVEIILIETKLKKIYNPKKLLAFSKAIKEFYEEK